MPLYEVTDSGLLSRPPAQFAALGLYERADLQRLLRDDISPLGDDLLVIAEEFGEWEDARRRIDLLALDKSGRIVVIELKRTDDGGHMELQALRYAAMVSSMQLDEVVAAYAAHLAKHRPDDDVDARAEIEAFLDPGDGEVALSTDVRIVLVSADFGREITTTVLWLNNFEGMDIRCVRLIPYELAGSVYLDIQQVIPLREAADYQVRLRRKETAQKRARSDGRDFTRYHVIIDGEELPDENKRNSVRVMVEQLAARGVPLAEIKALLPDRRMRVLPGIHAAGEETKNQLAMVDPKADVPRWFCEKPLHDHANNQTYVLYRMWGLNTEPTLRKLADGFPESKVSFRAATDGDA